MGFQQRFGAGELLRRLPRRYVYSGLELLLIALIALQLARLFWHIATPIGPFGQASPTGEPATPNVANEALFQAFDPFFQPLVASGPLVVSDLDLDLYGVRVDRVSGRGAAIIGVHGGAQQSFNVGDEIIPGVTLAAVAFDSVTIDRGGTSEQLFIDQSVPARTIASDAAESEAAEPEAAGRAPAGQPVFLPELMSELSLTPKIVNGRLDGAILDPAGNGELFRKIGLMPKDELLSVNRMRVDSAARAGNIGDMLPEQGTAVFEIRRGGQVKSISFEFTK